MFEKFFWTLYSVQYSVYLTHSDLRQENAKAGRHSTNHVQDAPRISLFLDGGGGWCSSLTRKLD